MMFTNNQIERFSRQLILKDFGPKAQGLLAKSKILVIGAGGLGSPALLYLTGAGVGKIGIAEFDNVDISNLHRQILFSQSDVGTPKIDTACSRLKKINPDTVFELHREKISSLNIKDIITKYQFVIDGTDTLSTKMLINDACVLNNIPFSHAGALEFGGQVMTVIPMKTSCLRCVLGRQPQPESLTCAQSGVLGPVTGILGSVQALEAIKFVTGIGQLLTNSVLSFDGLHLRFHTIKSPRSHLCPLCGETPSILSLQEKDYVLCQ